MPTDDHPDWLRLRQCVRCRYPFTGRGDSLQCPECGYPLGPGHVALACWTHAAAAHGSLRIVIRHVLIFHVLFLSVGCVAWSMPLGLFLLLPLLGYGVYVLVQVFLRLTGMRNTSPNCVIVIDEDSLCRVLLGSNQFENCPWQDFMRARVDARRRRLSRLNLTYRRDPEEASGPFNVTIALDPEQTRQLIDVIEYRIRDAARRSGDLPCHERDQT